MFPALSSPASLLDANEEAPQIDDHLEPKCFTVCSAAILILNEGFPQTEDPGRGFPSLSFETEPARLLVTPKWSGLLCVAMDTATWVLFLFVFQVQTLYYSPDHKLVDGGLVIEGHSEVFGAEEDHLQFVQVLNSS